MKSKVETKNQKNKKVKNIKVDKVVEDNNEIKAFAIIVIVIIVLIGCIYGLTEILKDDEPIDNKVTGEINYDLVTVGTLLNRPYDEYLVLLYNEEDNNSALYSSIMTKYMQKSGEKDYVKLFQCDLSNSLNKMYYNVNEDNKSNPKATKIEDFDFGDVTLLKIKNGKVSEYIEDLDKIKELLK